MDLNKEFFACLALRHTPGLGPRTWKKILSAYDSAYEAVRDVRGWAALRLARRDQIEAAEREVWRADAEAEYRAARSRGMDPVTWNDPRFPQRLREIADPPLLLYAAGDAGLLAGPCVAVVGARKCTRHGLDAAARISTELSRMGLTVVSGLALGVDREAHLGGLSGVGSSVAVLGCGLDVRYPKGNGDLRAALEERGCVVSEFAPGTPPDGNNFPHRNRIISGLSMGVVVAEAAKRSGSLITARLAGEQGRDVFALPGPAGQAAFTGCHSLIREGAVLADSGEDVLRELRYQFGPELNGLPRSEPKGGERRIERIQAASLPPERAAAFGDERPQGPAPLPSERLSAPAPDPDSDPDGRAVWDRLGRDRVHIDELTRGLGWESARVSQTLLLLEMSGAVRQWPGMRYSRS
ncbi:DNA-processing protein DprA [Paucidesulfovibrio longus]|uniref:DNA-processing protein DprA n=1 Tax=Paucidesulfovibrio longus TaxID=889 RepID=UPI0003B30F40|nr:DNA-processing protein DprA [Paucidesulfovibrio longus]